MRFVDHISISLTAQFVAKELSKWQRPCRPRILVLTDGGLNYRDNSGFGLSCFIHGITLAPGVVVKPDLTLAHRMSANGEPPTVVVGPDVYTLRKNFKFDGASPAVTVANYDQIWIFGINGGPFALSEPEVGVISTFMNAGGGVFATGDHASLGRELSGSLPRIRHMREWRDASSGGVPMGSEQDVNLAVLRNDTVVNPGANHVYEFADQSDDIPQRIYPNYKVVDTDGLGGTAWTARVHPVLMLPGAPAVRSSGAAGGAASGFSRDLDVLPDHPHESQCYEVTGSVLDGTYDLFGQSFAEFQPSEANAAVRVPGELVAYAVAGGRSVLNGQWKPPVKPHMYGVISAYDGRLAQPYPGQHQRPGRIVCDATWHHYVNINLDGTESGRNGLAAADLNKIYAYYRNIINWLQPANRVRCFIFWDVVALRVHLALREELMTVGDKPDWRSLVGLGRAAQILLTEARGHLAMRDQVVSLFAGDSELRQLADVCSDEAARETAFDIEELIEGVYGRLVYEATLYLPDLLDTRDVETKLADGPASFAQKLVHSAVDAMKTGAAHQLQRLARGAEQATHLTKMRIGRDTSRGAGSC